MKFDLKKKTKSTPFRMQPFWQDPKELQPLGRSVPTGGTIFGPFDLQEPKPLCGDTIWVCNARPRICEAICKGLNLISIELLG